MLVSHPRLIVETLFVRKPAVLLALLTAGFATTPATAHPHRDVRSSPTATFYNRGDSDPHLANGDTYGEKGPWFCAVDTSRRDLLNHRIRVVNKRNGRSHVFLVADLGRFSRGNIDVSRGGSERLSGRGIPDSFPVAWQDLGPASGADREPRRHRHALHLSPH